jgi:hypothetical protein
MESSGRVTALDSVGTYTIEILRLNRPHKVRYRRFLMAACGGNVDWTRPVTLQLPIAQRQIAIDCDRRGVE